MNIRLIADVEIADDADPDALAEGLGDYLAADPDNLFPAILVVDDFGYQVKR